MARKSRLLRREPEALVHAVVRSCEIKAEVVGHDERDTGARALLNFGHTFGHAIESGAGYGSWLHGEAVSAGMALATRYSVREGMLDAAQGERFVALLRRLGLPVAPPRLDPETWLTFMGRDKKNEGGRVTLILLQALGRAAIVKDAREGALRDFLTAS